MSDTTEPKLSGADRAKAARSRRARGLICYSIEAPETCAVQLTARGFLEPGQANDKAAVSAALSRLVADTLKPTSTGPTSSPAPRAPAARPPAPIATAAVIRPNGNGKAGSYQNFPMMLTHPDHEPAVPQHYRYDDDGSNAKVVLAVPAKFPPVTVNSEDELRTWEAKGYRAGGRPDPEAVERQGAHAGGAYDVKIQKYPMMVGDRTVKDEAEEAAARAALVQHESRPAA